VIAAADIDALDRVEAPARGRARVQPDEVDVLILATGFKVFEKGNMPAFTVTGAGGVDLEAWWDEHRFQAYQGVSVPGFPNFFAILGPYGYNGSSYFNLIETQMAHIVRCLRHARQSGATRVEVTPEANARYFEKVLGRRRHQNLQSRAGHRKLLEGCRHALQLHWADEHNTRRENARLGDRCKGSAREPGSDRQRTDRGNAVADG
jgi:cation diffusion facilitator CzcD-associated flavoprotein CzcO